MRKRAILPIIALIVGLYPAPAEAAATGSFSVSCKYSHTLPDDPIVVPGQPGGSHLHDFFGNSSSNADSTYQSMTGQPTTCRFQDDTAGYWNPTAFLGDTQLTPMRVGVYYRGTAGTVGAFPEDLKMLAGNKSASSRAENPRVQWDCGGTDATPIADHPYDCTPYAGRVIARIAYPSCWNGQGLDPTSVAYPDGGRCPSPYTHRLPRVMYRVSWAVQDPCLGTVPCTADLAPDLNIKFHLSSGPYYTMHADLWNTWNQATLNDLVTNCLNAHISCGEQVTKISRRRSRR